MENYMRTYEFEKTDDGFVAKLGGKPVAEYSKDGALTRVLDWLSLPVQEYVPKMLERCLA